MNRRHVLAGMGAGLALAALKAEAVEAAGPGAPVGKHEVKPLPFDPAKLKGLSDKLLTSHHDNNYAGAVKNLNQVEEHLAGLTKDSPGFLVAGLRERELTFANSVVLHEAYFGNLGGDGKRSGPIEKALSQAFGSAARWEEEFRAIAGSLGGGSGWAVLDYDFHGQGLRCVGSGGHPQAFCFGAPLLVLDMYEHSYALDFGAAAAKYVDAFFANLKWDEVNRRLERALKAAPLLRG